ncbi:hypothetical protein TNCT_541981 [Trichonephila clavata]|uniref:Uncharacterized protein n=1 Tax=Trichonephila clavata TaxID=2740835 RepID=A0A8X6L976_TRICU|nr:hypothetical protein TNCT_541981 [Trichonephila clavata]
MAAREEKRGLVVCFFAGNLNPSSSTVALLRVFLLTSELETLLALMKVLFSAGAAAFFCFEMTLATILSRATWFGGTLKSGTFRESPMAISLFRIHLGIDSVLFSDGWYDSDLASAGCISCSEFEQLRYSLSLSAAALSAINSSVGRSLGYTGGDLPLSLEGAASSNPGLCSMIKRMSVSQFQVIIRWEKSV